MAVSGPNCTILPLRLKAFVIGKTKLTVKHPIKIRHFHATSQWTLTASPTLANQNKKKNSLVSRLTGADWTQSWTKLTGPVMFIQIYFVHFCTFWTTFSHFRKTILSWLCMLVISNYACGTRPANLESLARLFPEFYSTQCYY